MQRSTISRAGLGVLALAALTAGCGVFESSTSQASSESSSKSSSSPFKSSSRSSEGNEASALAADVRDYSRAYARTAGNYTNFQRGVGAIARSYGVFDWEGDPDIHRAMGSGFREAGLDVDTATRLGRAVSETDDARLGWVLAGYGDPGPQ